MVPTIGTALIILFARQQTTVGKLLGSRLLVGTGLISYSAYLWHHPLFVFARERSFDEPSKSTLAALALATFALAYLSWKFVEMPFRNRQRTSRRQIFVLATTTSAIFVGIGLLGYGSNGFSKVYTQYRLTDSERFIYGIMRDNTDYDPYLSMVDNGNCIFWERDIDSSVESRFQRCARQFSKAIIILGDSHAMNIYNAFAKSGVSPFVVGITQGACRPHDDNPTCQYGRVAAFVKNNRDLIDAVIFHESGAYLIGEPDGTVYYDSHSKNEVSQFSLHTKNIAKIQSYLDDLSAYTRVFWLGPFVEARVPLNDVRKFPDGFKLNKEALDLFQKLDNDLRVKFQIADTKFKYIPFSDIMKIDREFLFADGCWAYKDRDHLSRCGESVVAKRIARVFHDVFEKL